MARVLSEFGTIIGMSNDIQVSTMPDYSTVPLGAIVQYVGTTTADYINGYFYKCTANGWEQNNTQPSTDVSGKADKVNNATNGHLAGLDANGNLTDSGKAPSDFAQVSSNTLTAKVLANATSIATLSDKQVRNIYAGTADLTAGSSALPTGDIYFVYE